jgi:hypothetical protein
VTEAMTSDIVGFVPIAFPSTPYARDRIVWYVHNRQARSLRRIRKAQLDWPQETSAGPRRDWLGVLKWTPCRGAASAVHASRGLPKSRCPASIARKQPGGAATSTTTMPVPRRQPDSHSSEAAKLF